MSGEESRTPTDLTEVERSVHPLRWALYRSIKDVLDEIAGLVEWQGLYTTDAELPTYLEWGLYLEQLVPVIHTRVVSAVRKGADEGSPVLAELEDDLSWSLGRLEDSLRQPLGQLRQGMLMTVTARRRVQHPDEVRRVKEAICGAIADVYGRLRADLRRFAAFVVAEDRWELAGLETVLFEERLEELEQGKGLKMGLARLMEAFRGGPERVPLQDIFRLWLGGEVLAIHGMADLERVVRELGDLLDEEDRVALYVSDYVRLRRWESDLQKRFNRLREDFGDDGRQRHWLQEMAAILDSEILSWCLGWDRLRGFRFPRDVERVCHQVVRKPLSRAGFDDAEIDALYELKGRVEEAERPEGMELADEEVELLSRVVVAHEGTKLVDRLRNRLPLPETLRHLEHLHPVVLEAEDGLKTFLLLLYGQVQQRDLHLLEKDAGGITVGEKLLALQEMEYRLQRIERAVEFAAFEAVRDLFVPEARPVMPQVWNNVRNLLSRVIRELVPRLERIATFPEVEGLESVDVEELSIACQKLCSIAKLEVSHLRRIGEPMGRITETFERLAHLRVEIAAPSEMPDIEQYLETLG